jgi:hypothetical protein
MIKLVRVLLITIVMIELVLQMIDYGGVYSLYHGYWTMSAAIQNDPIGYTYRSGTYHTKSFTATILKDGSRAVPASVEDGCPVVFIGDSFVWGQGVSDEDVFINHIAHELGIHAINHGMNGYNASQIAQVRERYSAAFYVYLHNSNDWEYPTIYDAATLAESRPPVLLALWVYTRTTPRPPQPEQINNTEYLTALESLATDERVLTFTFDSSLQDRYSSVVVLPSVEEHRVSVVDYHPNATGHELIARAMLPAIQNMMESHCESQ